MTDWKRRRRKINISVVIPAYNEEANIGSCLKSLEFQTRRADEIIIVDNESEDDTVQIARQHGARVISYPRPYRRHGNIGLVRQKGTEAAMGDIIVSTDADLIHPTTWLQKIEKQFIDNPHLVLLGGPVYVKNRHVLNEFIFGVQNFHRSYWSAWGIPIFYGGNTSFRKNAFMLTEGYKGAAAHGPVEEWVLSFRLSRMGEWLWDDDVYCFLG